MPRPACALQPSERGCVADQPQRLEHFPSARIRSEHAVAGFRNRAVRGHLHPGTGSAAERRRQTSRITRQPARLRAHGLLKKVSGTHRRQVTETGRRLMTALLTARQADVDQLTQLAA